MLLAVRVFFMHARPGLKYKSNYECWAPKRPLGQVCMHIILHLTYLLFGSFPTSLHNLYMLVAIRSSMLGSYSFDKILNFDHFGKLLHA